jgi:hypothetical protein
MLDKNSTIELNPSPLTFYFQVISHLTKKHHKNSSERVQDRFRRFWSSLPYKTSDHISYSKGEELWVIPEVQLGGFPEPEEFREWK